MADPIMEMFDALLGEGWTAEPARPKFFTDIGLAAIGETDVPIKDDMVARAELTELGLTADQWSRRTGMGLRHVNGAPAEDTLLNKYRTGCLSRYGVMAVLFGADSPEHHAGRVT